MDDGRFLFTVKTLKSAHSALVLCCHLLYISLFIDNNTNIAILVTKNGFSVIFTA